VGAGPRTVTPTTAAAACSDADLAATGAECATLAVPLDHSRPGGATISLALSRVRHTVPDAQYQGVVLTNPGGPGGSGLFLSRLGQSVPNGVGDKYDWIGFDPRGVGASRPALSCDPNYAGYDRPAYDPEVPGAERAWLARSKAYAAACGRAGGRLLDNLTTIDSARDMDLIRRALGVEQINYYGFSYGTYLGSVYATLFPQRVRRMVLDANVDPTRVWYQANIDQDIAFDRNIKIYFDWVAKYDSVYHLGTSGADVEKLYYDQLSKLDVAPAGGKIGPAEWNDIFLTAGYFVLDWEAIAEAFSDWVNRADPAGLIALYPPPGDDNSYAIYLGVVCTDAPWPRDYARVRADNVRVDRRAPFVTWGNAWFNAPCVVWPARSEQPVRVDGSKAPGVLLISETLDAATPFSGSLTVRRLFPRSSLIEGVGGTTHAASLFGEPCVDNTVAAYLDTGVLPARRAGNRSDKQCPALPQPDPTAAAADAARSAGAGAAAPPRAHIPQRRLVKR
jgi:pimeloyl-ACP methyl ester carboxylesterase